MEIKDYKVTIAKLKAILEYLSKPANMKCCLWNNIISFKNGKLVVSKLPDKIPSLYLPNGKLSEGEIDEEGIYEHKKAMYSFGMVALIMLSKSGGKPVSFDEFKLFWNPEKNIYKKFELTLLEASFVEHCLMSKWEKRKTAQEMLDHLLLHPKDIAKKAMPILNTNENVKFNLTKRVNSKIPLAGGGFGQINLVTKVPKKNRNLRIYIEKNVKNANSGKKFLEFIQREIKINKIIASENISGCVKVFDSVYNKSTQTMILKMEYVPSLTLDELIEQYGALPEHILRSIMKTVLTALNCLHKFNIVYRDFKPENILIVATDGNLCGKLIDFGIAKELDQAALNATIVGTPETAAPEVGQGKVSLQSDIYSIGATCFKALFKKPLFSKSGSLPTLTEYSRSYTIIKDRCLSLACIDFLQNCLQIDPSRRFPSMQKLLSHDFFNSDSNASQTYQKRDYELTTTKVVPID